MSSLLAEISEFAKVAGVLQEDLDQPVDEMMNPDLSNLFVEGSCPQWGKFQCNLLAKFLCHST